jgi:hypothetical protein
MAKNNSILKATQSLWNLAELQNKGFKVIDRKETAKKKAKAKAEAKRFEKPAPPKNKKIRNATKVTPYQLFQYLGVNYKNEYSLTFPSKLEWYAYDVFMRNGLGFDYQFPFELQPKIDNTRSIKTIIDFVFDINGFKVVVDTKGHQTSESKLKMKMLKSKLTHENIPHTIILLRTKKQILDFTKKLLLSRKSGKFVV